MAKGLSREQQKAMFANLKNQDLKTLAIRLQEKDIDPELRMKINEEVRTRKLKEEKSDKPSVAPKQQSKESILQRLKGEGFMITTELSSDPDEPDDEPTEFTTVEITEKQTLDAIDGKSTAREMMDLITGTTEGQRLKFDIDTNNKLFELKNAGKIEVESGTNIWKKVK